MKRLHKVRLLRRDWVGYAILVLLCGASLVAALFLPWANTRIDRSINFSLTKPDSVLGILHTRWGIPALVIAVAVVLVGAVMLGARPRRYTLVLGFLLAAAGIGCFALADNAAGNLGGIFSPGIGLYITLFVGIVLVPIGLATAIVAFVLARGYGADTEAPAAPASSPTDRRLG